MILDKKLLKNGDLVLRSVRDNNLIDLLIRYVGNSGYGHVVMYLDGSLYEVTHPEGFVRRQGKEIDVRLLEMSYLPKVLRYKGELTAEQVRFMKIWWYLRTSENRSYGYVLFINFMFIRIIRPIINLFWNWFNIEIVPLSKWLFKGVDVCSTAVDTCYKSVGVDLLVNVNEGWTVPGDLLESDKLLILE